MMDHLNAQDAALFLLLMLLIIGGVCYLDSQREKDENERQGDKHERFN